MMRTMALVFVATLGVLVPGTIASAQAKRTDGLGQQDLPPDKPAGRKEYAVLNEVGGETIIIFVKPEDSWVEKGELVCELDSAAVKEKLARQQFITKDAEAACQQARRSAELAKIAVTEYVQGSLPQDLQVAKGEIALAESERKRAEDRLDWTKRQYTKGRVSGRQKTMAELMLQKAKFRLEQAQTKLSVLEKYTKEKTIKELQSQVEKAVSDVVLKESAYDLEATTQKALEAQVAHCRIVAPASGRVVYARRAGDGPRPAIEEGATVRQGQLLFRIVAGNAP
jgi:HlyD family secretion protein